LIEAPIIAALKADSALAALVTTFQSSPAIFADNAPETATLPYIVIREEDCDDVDLVISVFNVYIDYFDFNKSRVSCNAASKRIEHVLDNKILNSDDYAYIRMRRFSFGFVYGEDQREIQYNIQFQARACRKTFSAQL